MRAKLFLYILYYCSFHLIRLLTTSVHLIISPNFITMLSDDNEKRYFIEEYQRNYQLYMTKNNFIKLMSVCFYKLN
ncbi:Hypothetical predicted protein [Octopus vulgaris]|uniref:Uncharacterized protein n=1 Tax=Octopus vulgaris TaxID=6645 RepID=A0AA36AGH2_OCTVU|nr:Hypothetical predicted protein [Octopus vulgaris]